MTATNLHPLKAWRTAQAVPVPELAAQIGCARQTWYSWERGTSIPQSDQMVRIVEMTAGQVTPNDFYDLPDLGAPQQVAA
jgi:DNA-binding transcriptional regulator YiaG